MSRIHLPREESYRPGELMHPEFINGKRVWLDPSVAEINRLMQEGDPTLGWPGDPRLVLVTYGEGRGRRWGVERFQNGDYVPVCQSKPGERLDRGLIVFLRDHAVELGYDVVAESDKANAAIEKAAKEAMEEATTEAASRLYHLFRTGRKG